MRPLRVVVVMIDPPLPFGSAAGRWYWVLLRGLVERGHRVTAFAACGKPGEMAEARALFPAPGFDLRLYPVPERRGPRARWETLRRPFSYMFGDDLRRDLGSFLASGFDVLHLEQLWSGWLGLAHPGRALVNVHYLLEIDLAGLKPTSWAEQRYRWLERRAERRLLRGFRHFRTCTARLVEPIRRVNPSAVVSTVPFGLDAALYPFIPDDRRRVGPTLTLIGSMGWYPSRSAAERLLTRIWPEVRRRVPAARVEVVGWDARRALANYLGMPGVTVVEDVPDTRPYFESAGVLVYAPARGSGMKVKVQEAMAYGVPVVTTSEGVEGLPAEDGVHAGVCDDDDGLIERTVGLLADVGRQDRQRRAARRLIETVCGPGPTVDAVEALYARMRRPPPGPIGP